MGGVKDFVSTLDRLDTNNISMRTIWFLTYYLVKFFDDYLWYEIKIQVIRIRLKNQIIKYPINLQYWISHFKMFTSQYNISQSKLIYSLSLKSKFIFTHSAHIATILWCVICRRQKKLIATRSATFSDLFINNQSVTWYLISCNIHIQQIIVLLIGKGAKN